MTTKNYLRPIIYIMLNFVLLDETFSVMLIILHPLNESIVATLFLKVVAFTSSHRLKLLLQK